MLEFKLRQKQRARESSGKSITGHNLDSDSVGKVKITDKRFRSIYVSLRLLFDPFWSMRGFDKRVTVRRKENR